MSTNGNTQATSPVATNDGKVLQVVDLNVPANRIHGFVEMNRKDYFEDHSLDWALDEILTRGMAEITRQIKTAKVNAQNKAAGAIVKEFNMTPAEAKAAIKELIALRTAAKTKTV